jgi:ribosomal protein S27AE
VATVEALTPELAGVRYLLARACFQRRARTIRALWLYLSPGHGACPRCGERVLIVGGDIALEPVPVLARMRCPQCEQVANKGDRRRMRCWRCGDAGYLGERLPKRGVAINPHGIARVFTGRRTDGEAVHRPHVCPDD